MAQTAKKRRRRAEPVPPPADLLTTPVPPADAGLVEPLAMGVDARSAQDVLTQCNGLVEDAVRRLLDGSDLHGGAGSSSTATDDETARALLRQAQDEEYERALARDGAAAMAAHNDLAAHNDRAAPDDRAAAPPQSPQTRRRLLAQAAMRRQQGGDGSC